jgi:hypothetical protein
MPSADRKTEAATTLLAGRVEQTSHTSKEVSFKLVGPTRMKSATSLTPSASMIVLSGNDCFELDRAMCPEQLPILSNRS